MPANCETDGDCGDGFRCGIYWQDPCTNEPDGVACQTPEDECTFPDCYWEDGRRVFEQSVCGRPFLVEGSARTAPARTNPEWTHLEVLGELRVASLDPRLRSQLAERFTHLALMEHASIAAFARFCLELLAVGAPSSFLIDAMAALQDEQRHATLCFSLASAYRGAPVGPGPLSVAGAAPAQRLDEIVATTFLEGCVGETVAAMEARELARSTEDPVLARILSSIAEDEARHAALAWRFVQWAVGRSSALRAVVEELSRRAVSELREERGSRLEAGLERFGLLDAAQSREIRRRALHAIVAPCVSALLSEQRTTSPGTSEALA